MMPNFIFQDSFVGLIKTSSNIIKSKAAVNFTRTSESELSNDCFLLSDITNGSTREVLYLHKSNR